MNNKCRDCQSYLTEEKDMTEDEWEEVQNDDEAEGFCNRNGYPVPALNGCWNFREVKDGEK